MWLKTNLNRYVQIKYDTIDTIKKIYVDFQFYGSIINTIAIVFSTSS